MKLTDEFDRDILHYAFRYALGRRSYSVGVVIDELRRNWESLPAQQRVQIKDEIQTAIRDWEATPRYGGFPFMPEDIVRDWSAVLGWT